LSEQTLILDETLATIGRALEAVDLKASPFEPEEEVPGFVVELDPTGLVGGLIYLFPPLQLLAFYLARLAPQPAETLAQLAELVTRINNRLVVGNFEIDLEQRALRLKTSLDFTGVSLTDALVRNVLLQGLQTYSEYTDAIDKVVGGTQTATEALAAMDQ
jgi:hypothetical protein